MDIETRLESLENDIRRQKDDLRLHKRLGLAAACVLAVVIVIGAVKPIPKVIEAEKFELKDSTGKTRGIWEMGNEGPGFSLLDKNGGSLLGLGVTEIGSSLNIYDAHGEGRQLSTRGVAGEQDHHTQGSQQELGWCVQGDPGSTGRDGPLGRDPVKGSRAEGNGRRS